MERRLNERWLFVGEGSSAERCGFSIYRAHSGAWWIAAGEEAIGPVADRAIRRAVRVACTPTIDGCELSSSTLGIADLPKHPFRRGPRWILSPEALLPPSITEYDHDGLQPIAGCCTTFDSLPEVTWGSADGWEPYVSERPSLGGRLAAPWNAHPAGSLVFSQDARLSGFVVVDLGGSANT